MANGVLKLYPAMSGDTRPGVPAVITQTVDLADRRDAAPPALSALRLGALPDRGGLKSSSAVFKQPIEVVGIVSGELDFVSNKYDVDFDVTLYEQCSAGDYLQLPATSKFRSTYAHAAGHRHMRNYVCPQQLAWSRGAL